MFGIYRVAAQIVASRVVFSSTELVIFLGLPVPLDEMLMQLQGGKPCIVRRILLERNGNIASVGRVGDRLCGLVI
jgi:hypothetical protein